LPLVSIKINGCQFCGLPDEEVLCIRYEPGDHFPEHSDAPYDRVSGLTSFFSILIYLNDDFTGGGTFFPRIPRVVQPESGMAAIFPHHEPHQALPVLSGMKYVLHTYALYRIKV